MPTSTSNGAADAGPVTEGSNVPVEPAKIGDQESAMPTRPPTPRPSQTSAGERVADAGPSAEGSSAQVIGVGSNGSHGIYEAQRQCSRKSGEMRRWRRPGG
ncbi:hypothetical protein V502_11059 [Pseudogymnoascus sp. VKM F-4520 (FW-2644)]|nr:hypothetical protein V502_11059 [Pseudogymnoascus sp. VKM F-4520 (FW-2644)]